MTAPYDAIADWYEDTFLPARSTDLPSMTGWCRRCSAPARSVPRGRLRHRRACRPVRRLGWTPVGVDLSAGCCATRRAGCRPPGPTPSGCRSPTTASTAVARSWCTPTCPAIRRCCGRRPGCCGPAACFAHVGVHPCFCGGFADWSATGRTVLIRPGYADGHWTTESWTDQGIRDKVGASHWPLSELCTWSRRRVWSWSGSPRAAARCRWCWPCAPGSPDAGRRQRAGGPALNAEGGLVRGGQAEHRAGHRRGRGDPRLQRPQPDRRRATRCRRR